MRITTLIENSAPEGLLSEWGLSFYIEYREKKYLLDTGGSPKFEKNAETLGIHIKDVDIAALSHAHYDHAYGMDRFFEVNKTAPFYLSERAKENCYSQHLFFKKYIGIKKGTLKKHTDQIKFSSIKEQIAKGVWLVGHTTPNLQEIGKQAHMYTKENGKMIPESFAHEQSMVFEAESGLVIFNCCSHGGAYNIINEVQTAFPDKKVYAFLGGFHTFGKSDVYMKDFAEKLKATNIPLIYTGHCTGRHPYKIIREMIGDNVKYLTSGLVIDIE